MPVTLINPFTVPEDQEAAFLERWRRTLEAFSRMPGFIEARLHRNTGGGDPTFRFVNVALWESAEALRAAAEAYRPTEADLPGVEAHPGIFESVVASARGKPA